MTFAPDNRESRMADAVGELAMRLPEWKGDDKMLVVYQGKAGSDTGEASVGVFGYGENQMPEEVVVDLLIAAGAVLEAHGLDPNILLTLMGKPAEPEV